VAFNNIIPTVVVNKMLEDIRKEPKQLHFNEEIFYPCFYIDKEAFSSCNKAFMEVKSNGFKNGTISNHVDHPAFAALRKHLANVGLIEIPENPCVNGDRVVKPFYLNDVFFSPGENFYSASAMWIKIK